MAKRKKIPEGTFTATIEELSHDGRGIAKINGKATFIANALPGETVEFNYTYTKSNFDEGSATHIIKPSADRVTPHCKHFDICGGCTLQHLSGDAQLRHKRNTLLEQLKHFGQTTPTELLPPIKSPQWGYRNKARLSARYVTQKETLMVGFREKYKHFVANIDSCVVLNEKIGLKITELKNLFGKLSIPYDIPQIEVAIGTNKTAIIIRHLKPFTAEDLNELKQFANSESIDIYLQPGKLNSIHHLTEPNLPLLAYHLPKYALEYLFKPTDFTQINTAVNEQLVDLVLELLEVEPTDQILDLYCGLGNFTLPIAKYAYSVVGVEGLASLVERAKANAKHNHIHNTESYSCDLSQDFMQENWAKKAYNKLLLDPARSGALEVMQTMAKSSSLKKIVYVSCNPATLARDVGLLVNQHGYRLQKAGILDMFPHTSHVESIALLEHG